MASLICMMLMAGYCSLTLYIHCWGIFDLLYVQ